MKKYWDKLVYLVGLILVGLLYRQTKKTEQVESELSKEKANGEIKANEDARIAAKHTADQLVESYERLKRDGK